MKSLHGLLLLAAFLSADVLAQSGWQRITSPYPYLFPQWSGSTPAFANSYFWSADSGFVAYWSTTDGGATWNELRLPPTKRSQDSLSGYSSWWVDVFAFSLTH